MPSPLVFYELSMAMSYCSDCLLYNESILSSVYKCFMSLIIYPIIVTVKIVPRSEIKYEVI
jgi:hypothetical protein